MPSIHKVLIANRGEIALRIIRTCRERGVKTVAIYSSADEASPHVLAADESVCIGPAPSAQSYLDIGLVMDAAGQTQADAIHPGYGFLSENETFARECRNRGLTFIGPSPEAIGMMGDKTRARKLMAKAGIPYPPGTESAMTDLEEARQLAADIGYPVLIKAAAGGGGKGMRIVHSEQEFDKSVKAARSEANSAFGDERVFLEKYLEEPRHIEFQIFADTHGNVVHMFERECSIQRRHQKVIEEAPSAIMTEELRQEMGAAAVEAAKSCDYTGAGTVEFLVDKHRNFYFLEMNTRLQVEHPVTEWITGLDLVDLQMDVAEGKTLPVTQDQIRRRGHSIECRIYAEDPSEQFLPSTGRLQRHRIPSGPGVRVDAGIEEGQQITTHYDPMISKLCVHAPDRKSAIKKMIRALREYDIAGVKTTIPFCIFTLQHIKFVQGDYDTHFVQDHFQERKESGSDHKKIAAVVSALLRTEESGAERSRDTQPSANENPGPWWKNRKYIL